MPTVYDLEIADPSATPYDIWAADLSEQLADYNAPRPRTEAEWVQWADQICSLPELAELGSPDPRTFATWQAWGAALKQVTA